MLLLPCPWCGPRDAVEFDYTGEGRARPDPRTTNAVQWRDYLYTRRNVAGWTTEGWYHRMGCRRHVLIERDTTTNEVRPAATAPGKREP